MNYLEFAINMELEGEKYYLEQAEKNKDNSLSTVFTMLAKDERNHAEILKKQVNKLPFELEGTKVMTKYKSIFDGTEDLKSHINGIKEQLDVYRLALEKEKESIELYKKMLSETDNDDEKLLFRYLIEEEKLHYRIFDEIIEHVSRPKEWVESAEFGLRKKY